MAASRYAGFTCSASNCSFSELASWYLELLLIGICLPGSIQSAQPTSLAGLPASDLLPIPVSLRSFSASASDTGLPAQTRLPQESSIPEPPLLNFGPRSFIAFGVSISSAWAVPKGTWTMAAITAIAASTAVKTIHPSRDMFLNLLILSSSSGTNTYIRFPVQRVFSLSRT